MSSGMELSATAERINEQCQRQGEIYLHRPSGMRYRVEFTAGEFHELHPISGACRYVNDEQLANAAIWEKKP